MKIKKKKKKSLVEKLAKDAIKSGGKREFAVADDLDVIKHIKSQLKKEGMDLSDLRTKNQIAESTLQKEGKLYICAVTHDCPADYIVVGGVDFPRFIQPIDNRDARRRAASRRVSSRPQRLKRRQLTAKQVKTILKSAYQKWVTVTVPSGEEDGNGNPIMQHDQVRAINFIVLQQVSENEADPIKLRPVIKRTMDIKSIINSSKEVETLLVGKGLVKHKGKLTKRNIESVKNPAAFTA